MAVILAPIDNSLVVYTPTGSNFVGLLQSEMGNVGTSADGWDAAINAIIQSFPGQDTAITNLDTTAGAIATAIDNFNGIDTSAPFDPFPGPPPNLTLQVRAPTVSAPGAPTLPGLPGAPTQAPTVCLPTTPTPAPGWPPKFPTRGPRPVPVPITLPSPPCPAGHYLSPTTNQCEPIDNPPAPSSGPPAPPPLPVSPCPTGQVWDPTTATCQPMSSSSYAPGTTTVSGVIIPGTLAGASESLGTIAGIALGLPLSVIQMIPIFGQAVAAFLAFNSLFGGDWTADYAKWSAEMMAWSQAQPVLAGIYSLQQQIKTLQQELQSLGPGAQQMAASAGLLNNMESNLAALEACAAAGEFTTCPGYGV